MLNELQVRGNDFVQVKDIDVKRGTDAGENVLSLFLGIPDSRITSIISLKPRTEKNSSHARAAQTAVEFKDKRMTRHLSLQNSASKTSVTSSKASTRGKRGNKRARGKKSKSNTVERVKKLCKRTSPSGPKLRPRRAMSSDLPQQPVIKDGRRETFLCPRLF